MRKKQIKVKFSKKMKHWEVLNGQDTLTVEKTKAEAVRFGKIHAKVNKTCIRTYSKDGRSYKIHSYVDYSDANVDFVLSGFSIKEKRDLKLLWDRGPWRPPLKKHGKV